ncbi:MAG: Xaa-Pro peptidase family protein [Planctomycetota bacterium]
MEIPPPVPGLSVEGCNARQERLRRSLKERDLDAALISDPGYVHYFTGYWHRSLFSPVVLVMREGPTILSAPLPAEEPMAADEILVYESNRLGTLVDDQSGAAVRALGGRLEGLRAIGCDGSTPLALLGDLNLEDIDELALVLLTMRRKKHADEVALLRFAIAAAEEAYAYARETIEPGQTEVDLFAGMQAAAARYVGEAIGEFGNDFQIGATGSSPRRRPARVGEMAVFDLSVVVRGYACDMCRSFVVGGEPSAPQIEAHRRVMEVLERVEETAKPGTDCAALYQEARAMLDGYQGWSFPHHLGHGIGLCAHESPRLNPHWDDTLEPGDVFTAEPGLYGEDLRAGLRVEEIYHVSESGLETLTSFPTDIA